MGNVLSEEEERDPQTGSFLEEGFNLESPDADRAINFGTAAPMWQNNNSLSTEEEDEDSQQAADLDEQGQEVVMQQTGGAMRTASDISSNNGDSESGSDKRQQDDPKKMSYVQMARMGYQELVNAIIRPPRADYKVRASVHSCGCWLFSPSKGILRFLIFSLHCYLILCSPLTSIDRLIASALAFNYFL